MPLSTVSPVPNFETFRRSSPRPEGATVTLTARGTLNLSAVAVEQLGTPDHVRLLWDRDAQLLGVQPADEGDVDALRLSAARSGRTVAARSFAAWAGIALSPARRWPACLDDGVLCADLSRAGTPTSSNRAARPTDTD